METQNPFAQRRADIARHDAYHDARRAEDRSWISARDGKWHVAKGSEPRWDRDEATACGRTFRPLNVTHGEEPPTTERHKCRSCLKAVRP